MAKEKGAFSSCKTDPDDHQKHQAKNEESTPKELAQAIGLTKGAEIEIRSKDAKHIELTI